MFLNFGAQESKAKFNALENEIAGKIRRELVCCIIRKMKLIFEEIRNRNQCAAEVMLDDLKMQCTFSTAKIVTIPAGLSYFCGKLERSANAPAATVSICPNHEMRLKNAFAELFQNESE